MVKITKVHTRQGDQGMTHLDGGTRIAKDSVRIQAIGDVIDVSVIERLEQEIDQCNLELEPLKSFVLPGGGEIATRLHLARRFAVERKDQY